jgi:hypothetical protein
MRLSEGTKFLSTSFLHELETIPPPVLSVKEGNHPKATPPSPHSYAMVDSLSCDASAETTTSMRSWSSPPQSSM